MPTLSGIVKDSTGAFAQRLVRAYRRDTGAFVGQATSNPTTGAYSIATDYSGEHFVMMHDGTATEGDPYWDSVVLACHFNGTNGSTAFVDEKGHTLTPTGNSQISTTQSKFNGSAVYFDGAGDYITIPSGDFAFPGDFTVEAFVRRESAASYFSILEGRSGANATPYVFGLRSVGGTFRPDFFNGTVYSGTSTSVPLSTWCHVAFCRQGTTLRMFVDGVADAVTPTVSGTLTPSGTLLYIGAIVDPTYANGYINDLIITKAARYTANFTPPSSAFLGAAVVSGGTQNILAFDRVTPV